MNTPRKISDMLPSTCRKLLKSVKICLSSDKNNFDCFFETRCTFYVSFIVFEQIGLNEETILPARFDYKSSCRFLDQTTSFIQL